MVTLHKRKYGHELSIILIVTFHQYTDSRYKSFSENCFHANHSLVTFFLVKNVKFIGDFSSHEQY